MSNEYSVAEARNHLSQVIRDAETRGPVRITRRGKSAVVVISERAFIALSSVPSGFWTAYQSFQQTDSSESSSRERLDLVGLRDPSPGRPVDL